VDVRADIYSLGATLYYLLAGRTLFPEGKTAQKLVWQQIKDPAPVDRLRSEVPPELAAVVHRMLQKRPEDRFQTAAEVFDALEPFVPDEVPPPDPAWLPEAPARVAVARAAVPGASAPRVSGSTSQILAAAMRGGSGVTSASTVRRPRPDGGSGSGSRPALTPAGPMPGVGSLSETTAAALEDTHRTPPSAPRPDRTPPAPSAAPDRPFNPTVVIAALAAALLLAIIGIIILLVRD
jgi:serine/threonine-protein kinase